MTAARVATDQLTLALISLGASETGRLPPETGSSDYARSAQISVVGPLLLTTVKTPVAVSTV